MGYDIKVAIADVRAYLDAAERTLAEGLDVGAAHFQCELEDVLHRQWKPAARKARALIEGNIGADGCGSRLATREEVLAALDELRAEGGEIEAARLDAFDFFNRD